MWSSIYSLYNTLFSDAELQITDYNRNSVCVTIGCFRISIYSIFDTTSDCVAYKTVWMLMKLADLNLHSNTAFKRKKVMISGFKLGADSREK